MFPFVMLVVQNANCPKAEKLQTLIKAANVQDVEPIWTTLFAKVSRNRVSPIKLYKQSDMWHRLWKATMLRIFS